MQGIFVLPVLEQYLLYAPLHGLAALVDEVAVRRLQGHLVRGQDAKAQGLEEIIQNLRSQARTTPSPKEGAFAPAFLGLIPTRGCNLACEYCGFLGPETGDEVMDLRLARTAIDWYLDLVCQSGMRTAEIHFFGGEPFCAEEVMDFAFHYAWLKAVEANCTVRFEVATNGVMDERGCRWSADSLDSIVLSLDGPADLQDRQRHRKDGKGSFAAVARSARLLSERAAELSFRVCVTAETAGRLPEIATWLCQEFRPVAVSFEPLQPSAPSQAAGLLPPDPWAFAQSFVRAAEILEAYGVLPVYAAADIGARRVSFCPVAQDVPIVSPNGKIAACYLLEEDRRGKGFDLELGKIENGAVLLDEAAVEATRGLNVRNEPFCADCFCKWHCAGGCHVNHVLPAEPGNYDRLCIQTRLLTVRNILSAMGRDDVVHELFRSPTALERVAWQASDELAGVGVWV